MSSHLGMIGTVICLVLAFSVLTLDTLAGISNNQSLQARGINLWNLCISLQNINAFQTPCDELVNPDDNTLSDQGRMMVLCYASVPIIYYFYGIQ